MTIVVYPAPAVSIGSPLAPGGSVLVGIDAASIDKEGGSPDTAQAVHIVGNPAGDFAGANPLEQALDEATGVTLKVAIPGGPLPVQVQNPTPATVFPAVQQVNPVGIGPNASQENLGQLAQTLECLKAILVELRLITYQNIVASGIPDETEAFRCDPANQLISTQ